MDDAIQNAAVAAVFEGYPDAVRARLLELRQLILETAAETEGVGRIEETLKWGQPSYITRESGSGSTIRIDQVKGEAGQVALYVHCRTTLAESFQRLYPGVFVYEGKRALWLAVGAALPVEALKGCIALALTYHRWGREAGGIGEG
jgi:hypothetical protein